MTDVVVREARADEAGALAAIQASASLASLTHVFPPDRYPFPHDDVLDRWSTALADAEARVLVGEAESGPVGVAAVRPGWLDGLYVIPEWWGTGAARRLHDRALELLGPGGHRLWVLADNSRARRFYERRGWSENGETRVVPFPPHPLDVGYGITRS